MSDVGAAAGRTGPEPLSARASSEILAIGKRLRVAREQRGIGLRELSRRVDVSASMVSQIELGRVMPSVATLYQITSALGLSLDDLFAPTEANTAGPRPTAEAGNAASRNGGGPVQRADSRKRLMLGNGITWELLTAEPQSDVEFLRTIYDVGSESAPADALMTHGGKEYGLIEDGHLGVTVGFETYELRPGDSISFDSTMPHRLFNLADRPTTALWVVVGRRGDTRLS
jgi:transcriptional regulator with XRE-family HTH domain